MSCLLAGTSWADDATFTMASIFDGTNLSINVTSPVTATVSTNTSKSNSKTGKLGSDGNYFQIVLATETFTAASINGYINTGTIEGKNWAFQFSTDGGANWGSELTQPNDGNKNAHDITVGVTIPAGANGFRVIRRAGTSTQVNSITLTLAGGSTPPTPSIIAVTGVTLDQPSLTLDAGQTATLTATVAPADATNQNVTWSSSVPSVADVDQNGVVTAYTAGTTSITVTTEDGNKNASCSVTVNASSNPVAVTGVSLNKTETTIHAGASETLTATVTPSDATNKAVTWTTSTPTVASVQNGVVTANSVGTAIITVTTADGGHQATCTVTVDEAPVVHPSGVTLDKTSVGVQVGLSVTLTATVTPADAANKTVQWYSTNDGIATVSNGTVTGVSEGEATITVKTVDGNLTATCLVIVTAEPPVPSTNLTLHEPGVYEAKLADNGYATALKIINEREYEVFYASRTASSIASLPTTPGDKTTGIEDPATATANYLKTKDGWCEAGLNSISGGTSAKASASAEFAELYDEWRMSGNGITIHVKGYDQFSFYAADKSTEMKDGAFRKEQRFQVFINGELQPETQCNTSATVRRYNISSGEHLIEVIGMSGGDSKFFAFSLRLAQEPRTKYLKGNDSTQVIMQTTAPRSVYYYTKYNSKGETKLVWDGPRATGITLNVHSSSALGDSLVLGGVANCPVGTYNYRVVSYMNGKETSSIPGKFSVASDIWSLSTTRMEAYQTEEMDAIRFAYYALSPDAVELTWENGNQPAGITGIGVNGIYTIYGTPTAAEGDYVYSIRVAGNDKIISDTITILKLDLGNNPVLYLYKNDKAYKKDGIYKYLTSAEGNKVNLIARKTKADGLRPSSQYANYKWIMISEDVDADNPEILALARGEGGLPVLSMKSFSYTPGRLNWGEPDNGSLTEDGRYLTVWRADHPILKAFNKKQGERIQVLNTVVGKGLMPIDVSYAGTICLATALTRDLDDYYSDGPERTFIHEIPAEMRRGKKYICLPIGTESSNHLTADGKKLISEAIKYILSNEATITLPQLAITEFKIGNYTGKIDDVRNTITIDVQAKDSDDMKLAQPQIKLQSPLTFVTPGEDDIVDFSNWHYGIDYIVSDYVNKRKYNVVVRLYDPQGIENIEAGTWVNIFDIYGRKVATTNQDLRTMELPHGMYIIVTDDGQTIKVLK